MERKTFSPCPHCDGLDNDCADCEVQALRASGITLDELPRAAELVKAEKEGRCVVLPCKRQELLDMLSDLDAVGAADGVETYKTGYRNGYRIGRIELLRYVLGLPDGTRAEAEAAQEGAEHEED